MVLVGDANVFADLEPVLGEPIQRLVGGARLIAVVEEPALAVARQPAFMGVIVR